MKKKFFEGWGAGGLSEITEAAALQSRDRACVWIDVTDYSAGELVECLRSLGFGPDWLRACSEISGRTRVLITSERME